MARLTHKFLAAAICAVALVPLDATRPAVAQSAPSTPAPAAPGVDRKAHRLIIQVNTNDAAMMNLAINNANNVAQHYKSLGAKVQIEIVTFGPGLHMLRDDTSPVKERIKSLAESTPSITFAACDNTRANMSKAEQKEIPLVSQAKIVPSGVVRIMELQQDGWSYVRP